MPRTHDRDCLYKFATLDGAKSMISRHTLKWSSPVLFNDPFDTQTRLVADFDYAQFAERFADLYASILLNAKLPVYFDQNKELHRVAAVMRGRFDPAQKANVIEDFKRGALLTAAEADKHLAKFSGEISSQLNHGRAICLAEDINNVVMWSHYASNHTGVGFKFRVLDAIDHVFCIARKVNYADDYVKLVDGAAFAEQLFGAGGLDIVSLCWELAYLKHRDWQYEKEWRCYKPLLHEPVGDGIEYWQSPPELFEAVYLGCSMREIERQEVVELVRAHLPKSKIYAAKKSTRSFDLEFEEVYSPEQ